MVPHVVTSLISQLPVGGRGTSSVVPFRDVWSFGIDDGVFTLRWHIGPNLYVGFGGGSRSLGATPSCGLYVGQFGRSSHSPRLRLLDPESGPLQHGLVADSACPAPPDLYRYGTIQA